MGCTVVTQRSYSQMLVSHRVFKGDHSYPKIKHPHSFAHHVKLASVKGWNINPENILNILVLN